MTKSTAASGPDPAVRRERVFLDTMLPRVVAAGSLEHLFIHADLFVFPPLAEHNKGGGVEFQREPHCTEMAVHSSPTAPRFTMFV